MAALIVNNVLSSSLEVNYSYLETEEIFGYEVVGTYEIDLSDINFEQNDTVLIQGRDAIIAAYEKPNIVARIGADDYLKGRIQSFNFSAGTLVGSETVSIVIQESRRLDDYSSKTFSKLIPNPHLVEDFSETYDFNRSGADYSSTRNISLKYKEADMGTIPEEWNWLDNHSPTDIDAKNVHFTTGGPWFKDWGSPRDKDNKYAIEWCNDAQWLQAQGILDVNKDYMI